MEMTLTLPDDIGKQIQHLANPSEFVSKVLKEALKNFTSPPVQKESEPSKWAKIVQRVQNDPVHLDGLNN